MGRIRNREKGVLSFQSVHPALRPLLRAYLLGYVSAVGPRILTLLLQHLSKRKRNGQQEQQQQQSTFRNSLHRILRTGLGWQRFPTFCALTVGGSTLLETLFRRLLKLRTPNLSELARTRLSRWLSAFIAAFLSLRLLQSKESSGFVDTIPVKSNYPPGVVSKRIRFGGKTLDLTLFAANRAVDVLVGELWFWHKRRRNAAGNWTKAEQFISQMTDPSVFAISCALIMWTFIYTPTRLPRAYNKWIGSAAAVDGRLVEVLRLCRSRELRYGEETGHASLLQSMCSDYKWPQNWGDPVQAIPFPCEIVHMGCGSSCEYHALNRLCRSWLWAMATYAPLSLALQLRRPSTKGVVKALLSASRSSAFLGTFIALFYYGVCLSRTRIGPHIIGRDAASRQKIDGGICSATGCLFCGWSILLENPGRRKDLALFVAPRALATLLPRRYPLEKQWREAVAFAASTAVVFTCVLENKERVRGVLGNVLAAVLER